ncbi:MAG: VWA domain-containing protein [Bacteroidota bacterium]|nr:VWA domain-containing protein [Bacteroidota bacterium]
MPRRIAVFDTRHALRSIVHASLLILFAASSASAQLQLSLDTVDASQFPTIRLKVKARSGGNTIRGLAVDQFTVFEDGTVQAPITGSCDDTTKSGPVSVMLVIDRSGSMGPIFGSNAIVDAKRAAKAFVDRLSPEDEGALISFNDRPSYDQNWTRDKNLLKSKIDGISTGGGTAIWDAIITALSYLTPRTNRKVLILLTDGADGASTSPFSAARDALRTSGVTAFTIGLGSLTNEAQLRELALVSGGKYYTAPDSRDLDEIYLAISREIIPTGICELRYTSKLDCLDGSAHTVEVSLLYGGQRAFASGSFIAPTDSATLSYAFLSTGSHHSVDAGNRLDIPILLTRITTNRPISSYTFTIDFDRGLLHLDSVSTSTLTAGSSVNVQETTSGCRVRVACPSPVTRIGTLVTLHFHAADIFASERTPLTLSPPLVDQPCTVTASENAIVIISGRCERALIRLAPTAAKESSALLAVTPNPFNPTTTAVFRVAETGPTSIVLRDILGRAVLRVFGRDAVPGVYRVIVDGERLSSGMYMLELVAPDGIDRRSVLLLR